MDRPADDRQRPPTNRTSVAITAMQRTFTLRGRAAVNNPHRRIRARKRTPRHTGTARNETVGRLPLAQSCCLPLAACTRARKLLSKELLARALIPIVGTLRPRAFPD
jgi:hypothetical protein